MVLISLLDVLGAVLQSLSPRTELGGGTCMGWGWDTLGYIPAGQFLALRP